MHTPSALLGLVLPIVFALVLLCWTIVSLTLVFRTLVYGRRARAMATARARLADLAARQLTPDALLEESRALMASLPGWLGLQLGSSPPADTGIPPDTVAEGVAAHVGVDQLTALAMRRRAPRHNWKRIAALRLLTRTRAPGLVGLLAATVRDQDMEIGGAALSLLARTPDPRAGAALIDALKEGRHPASRVATYIDRFPLPLGRELRPLLHHPEATVRYWGATLLADARLPGLEDDLAALAADGSPLVRRAAVATLGGIGGPAAVATARALLDDQVWYVRAHAARALAQAEGAAAAETIAPLLADREWWVRLAAKESLQRLGEDVWSVLVPYLDHPDAFARNGAAEVLQNVGVLDSLIVLEAVTVRPSAAKLDMLRKIAAAGGARMTEALLERLDPDTRPRVRSLLETLGLEPVGAHP